MSPPIRHECKAHVVETGECLCLCGARQSRTALEVVAMP